MYCRFGIECSSDILKGGWVLQGTGAQLIFRWRKPAPQAILCNDPRHEKVLQILTATCFGAAAGHFESAKRLALDNGAGDCSIKVEVAADQLGLCTVKVNGTAGITAAGQGELAIVCQIQCFIEIFGFGRRKDRTENLFAEKAAARRDIDEDSGGDVTGVWITRHFSLPGEPCFLFSGFDDRQNALLSVTID